MALQWQGYGRPMENHLNSAFLNIRVILGFYRKLISLSDAQYAIIGGKFFGAKSDDLSKFQITFIKKKYQTATLILQKVTVQFTTRTLTIKDSIHHPAGVAVADAVVLTAAHNRVAADSNPQPCI